MANGSDDKNATTGAGSGGNGGDEYQALIDRLAPSGEAGVEWGESIDGGYRVKLMPDGSSATVRLRAAMPNTREALLADFKQLENVSAGTVSVGGSVRVQTSPPLHCIGMEFALEMGDQLLADTEWANENPGSLGYGLLQPAGGWRTQDERSKLQPGGVALLELIEPFIEGRGAARRIDAARLLAVLHEYAPWLALTRAAIDQIPASDRDYVIAQLDNIRVPTGIADCFVGSELDVHSGPFRVRFTPYPYLNGTTLMSARDVVAGITSSELVGCLSEVKTQGGVTTLGEVMRQPVPSITGDVGHDVLGWLSSFNTSTDEDGHVVVNAVSFGKTLSLTRNTSAVTVVGTKGIDGSIVRKLVTAGALEVQNAALPDALRYGAAPVIEHCVTERSKRAQQESMFALVAAGRAVPLWERASFTGADANAIIKMLAFRAPHPFLHNANVLPGGPQSLYRLADGQPNNDFEATLGKTTRMALFETLPAHTELVNRKPGAGAFSVIEPAAFINMV